MRVTESRRRRPDRPLAPPPESHFSKRIVRRGTKRDQGLRRMGPMSLMFVPPDRLPMGAVRRKRASAPSASRRGAQAFPVSDRREYLMDVRETRPPGALFPARRNFSHLHPSHVCDDGSAFRLAIGIPIVGIIDVSHSEKGHVA